MFVTPAPKTIVVKFPLSENSKSIFSMAVENEILNFKIDEHLESLENQKIECFKRRGNVIVTEKGYFVAIYEKDIDTLKFKTIEII
ncbi:MAG: hypothetical protein AABY22_21800 [Nanoarchaeota archaeon]